MPGAEILKIFMEGEVPMLDSSHVNQVEAELFERLLGEREKIRQELTSGLEHFEEEMRVLRRIYDQWKLERGVVQVPVVPRAGEHFTRSEDVDRGFFQVPVAHHLIKLDGGGSRQQ